MFGTITSAARMMQICQASSMHPLSHLLFPRLVEEMKEMCGLELENEDVHVATTFGDFIQLLVKKLRGDNKESECIIDYVSPGPLYVGLALQTSQTLTSVISMTHREKLSIPESRALKSPPSIS